MRLNNIQFRMPMYTMMFFTQKYINNKIITHNFIFKLSVLLLVLSSCSAVGQVVQLTNSESLVYDSNYEYFFEYEGEGCYTSLIDDKVTVYKVDSDELIYSTSFDLCEEEIIDWQIVGDEIVYVSNYEILIEHISGSNLLVYPFENTTIDYEKKTVEVGVNHGIINLSFFPDNQRIQFDVVNRKFIDPSILNISFVTADYIYHQNGGFSGDGIFSRTKRDTHVRDTLFQEYTKEGSIKNNRDYYFLSTEEISTILIYDNDAYMSYEFDHGNLSSAIVTDDEKVVFAEIFSGGTVIYTLDEISGSLINRDTIWSDNKVSLLDSYGDRLYVEYSQQFEDNYGYMDYPYTSVEIIVDDLDYFNNYYLSEESEVFIIHSNDNEYNAHITVFEQDSEEIHDFQFSTRKLWLDSPLEVTNTSQGLRFIVSEDEGKVVYEFNSETNSINRIRNIFNKRGLGTAVVKNENTYLISDEHSLFSRFEYLDPTTLDLMIHQVDGVIHGNVIPWEGKYYYIRNQEYNDLDEDFFLDFVLFDPSSNITSVITNDFFYPKDNVSFSNINFGSSEYGFVSIYNSPLIFDLRNESLLSVDDNTKDLLNNIYYETENHFYSSNDQNNYRISKSDYSETTLLFEGENDNLIPVNKNSFIILSSDDIYYIKSDDVIIVDQTLSFTPNYYRVFKEKLFLGVFDGMKTTGVMIDLVSLEEIQMTFDGYIIESLNDYTISLNTFEAPYELISTNMVTGVATTKWANNEFKILYTNDESIYFWEQGIVDVSVFSSQWDVLDIIDGSVLYGSTFDVISEKNALPLVLKIRKPRFSNQYFNLPDFILGILDPRQNTLVDYFNCEEDYRLNKIFNINSVSHMLLRTKEDGYQVCQFEIPDYEVINNLDESEPISNSVSIFPNPTSGVVTFNKNYEEVSIFNSTGQFQFGQYNTSTIDLSTLSNGIYFLRIRNDKDNYHTISAVKYSYN